jgi:transposase InsO family protein
VELDGMALCGMSNEAISNQGLPVRLSFDHDLLFRCQRWQANLRILGVEAVQTVPLVPWSHPFVERLIGSLRREYLDQLLYWNAGDLERKLELFRGYFNATRVHQKLGGDTSEEKAGGSGAPVGGLAHYRWQRHCHGLFQLPKAA